jgi:NADH-quinone oxidoreductase subunit E
MRNNQLLLKERSAITVTTNGCACTQELPADPTLDAILDRYRCEQGALIPILQDVQSAFEYLPKDKLTYVSRRLSIPLSRIYSVATFYKSFSLAPRGQHLLTLCMGTVCFLKGADKIHKTIMDTLNVEPGGTSPDRLFTYSPVNCLGACALAPVMVIDDKYYNKVEAEAVAGILAGYEKKEE